MSHNGDCLCEKQPLCVWLSDKSTLGKIKSPQNIWKLQKKFVCLQQKSTGLQNTASDCSSEGKGSEVLFFICISPCDKVNRTVRWRFHRSYGSPNHRMLWPIAACMHVPTVSRTKESTPAHFLWVGVPKGVELILFEITGDYQYSSLPSCLESGSTILQWLPLSVPLLT